VFVCGGYVICHHVTRIGADHADLGDWVRVSEHRAFATDERPAAPQARVEG
jgi:hypothetical protein